MSTQVRSVRARPRIRPPGAKEGGSEGRFDWGRLLQMSLALYLAPALLVVLLVGGIGMLVLAAARAITWIARGPGARPRSPVEPESSPR
jgi:hypothetical protein